MGLFVAIEGGDGSGKGTQTKLLVEHYRQQGKNVLELSFPQYGNSSALYVTRYLNGSYGAADEVPADLASLAYALDRFDAKDKIINHLKKPNSLVVSDRSTASNLAHQGTKIANPSKRKEFYDEIQHLEYELLGSAKPDINIVLIVPTDIAQANVDKKAARNYTSAKRDIHEADISHLERAKANYEELTNIFPESFIALQCHENSSMRDVAAIQADIIKIVDRSIAQAHAPHNK